jgi:hypothetical protein
VINTLGAPGSMTGTDLQGINGNLAGHYALGSNIDASATATSTWNFGADFTPIGTANPFAGTFDGLGHTISGLTINLPTTNNVGLFANTGSASIVQNVGLVGGSVVGEGEVGALIGENQGTVGNSYATGNVTGTGAKIGGLVGLNLGGTISASHAGGQVEGASWIGGLVGYNQSGTISDSYATGIVGNNSYGGGYYVGGLVGYNAYGSIVTNSFATGAVTGNDNIGGLVGVNYGASTISNSHATGTVTQSMNSGGRNVGGLVGINYGMSTITNSYASGVVTGQQNVGGLVGENGVMVANDGGTVTHSYATGRVIGAAYAGIYGGTGVVGGLVGMNNGAITNTYATGSVNSAGNNTGGLVGFNRGLISTSHAGIGSVNGSRPDVGGLVGYNYSGNNYNGTVVNSYATGVVAGPADVGGLVGYNASSTSVVGSFATGAVTGTGFVGGLVGANYGVIATSHATGLVSAGSGNYVGGLAGSDSGEISASYATGAVSGGSYVGGLVGSAATEGVEPISNSYATGAVSGASNVGGLVGQNIFTITKSYATGNVRGTGTGVGGLVGSNGAGYGTVANSYATGTVSSSGSIAGGLVGNNYGGISNSYATGAVTAATSVGGLVGINSGGGTISNTYATGSVAGTGSAVGALAGNNSGTVTESFWNSSVNAIGIGTGTTTGAIRITTAAMMTMSNFASAGWSIADTGGSIDVWRIYEGNTAPLLLSFLTPLTVSAPNTTDIYTGTPVTGLTDASYSRSAAATSGHIINRNNAYNGAVNVGTYTADLYSDQQGYDISYVHPILLTLTPATLTVTANTTGKTYGQANPALSGTVTGFVGTDTLASATTGTEIYATAATATSNVGTYAISGTGLAADYGNYTFSYAAANATAFTITPATLTVGGEMAASRTYNGTTDATLTGGTLAGLVSGDTVTLTQAGHFSSSDAGTAVPVTASDTLAGAGAGNYVLTQPTDIAANITPAILTYTAASASFTAGQTPSGLSGTLAGFVAGQTQLNATTGSLVWITTAGDASAPGRYAIDGSGLTTTNYVFVDAPANATALTLLTPIAPPAGPTTAALLKAQNAVTSIEVNLPSSQTNIQLAMLDVSTNIAVTQSLDVDTDNATEPADSTVLDKRSVHRAIVPSLRVMRGGVRLPADAVDVNRR